MRPAKQVANGMCHFDRIAAMERHLDKAAQMNLPARPYTKAEKHLDFNFKVAVKLLRDMGSDNGCTFIACPTHHHELLVAIEACRLEGLRFGLRNIAIMAYGEETERQQRFKSYPSFALLDAVLRTIFGGCKRCVTEMPI